MRMRKVLVKGTIILGIAWLAACVALYEVMLQPPEAFAHVMAQIPGPVAFLVLPFETLWTHARAGHLEKGDLAPDFALSRVDNSGTVQLSALTSQRRPVVLIFGSYT